MNTTISLTQSLDDEGRSLLFTGARTANSFSGAPVTDAELADIWELTRWAPTAANLQPLRALFVRTEDGKRRLNGHLAEGNRSKAASAPVTAVLALDTRYHEHIPTVLPIKPELLDAYEADAKLRDEVGRFSAGLQIGYFILGVRALGLTAGPMAGFDRDALDADFFPQGRWRSLLAVNIGHPGDDPWFDRLPRLDRDQALAWA